MDIKTVMAMIMAVIINLLMLVCIFFCIWVAISLVDISIHNFAMNYVYSEWNMFEVFLHINKQSVVSSFILYYFLLLRKTFYKVFLFLFGLTSNAPLHCLDVIRLKNFWKIRRQIFSWKIIPKLSFPKLFYCVIIPKLFNYNFFPKLFLKGLTFY